MSSKNPTKITTQKSTKTDSTKTKTTHKSNQTIKHNTNINQPNDKIDYIIGKKHFLISAISLGTTLLSILIFTSVGYIIDRNFNTKPIFTITGLATSYIVTQILITYYLKKKFK